MPTRVTPVRVALDTRIESPTRLEAISTSIDDQMARISRHRESRPRGSSDDLRWFGSVERYVNIR